MESGELDAMLKAAGIPIDGCAANSQNKAEWRVDFAASATLAQRQQAADLIAAYVPLSAGQKTDAAAQAAVNDKKLQAVVLALWECIPSPLMTKAQMKARAVAIFKTL